MQVALTTAATLLLFAATFQAAVWFVQLDSETQRQSSTEPFPEQLNTALGRQAKYRKLAIRSPHAGAHVIEIWSLLHPLNASETSLIPGGLERSEVEQITAARGWDTDDIYHLASDQASWPTQIASRRPVFSQLCYVGIDGEVTVDTPAKNNSIAWTVHRLSQLIRPPTTDELEQLSTTFSEVADELATSVTQSCRYRTQYPVRIIRHFSVNVTEK